MSASLSPTASLQSLLQETRDSMSRALLEPTDQVALAEFALSRERLAEALRAEPEPRDDDQTLAEAESLITEIEMGGAADLFAPGCDSKSKVASKSLWGVLANLLVSHPWNWSDPLAFDRVPYALWGVYARACFRAPGVWANTNEKERYFSSLAHRLAELSSAAQANRGSAAVRAATTACHEMVDPSILLETGREAPRMFAHKAIISAIHSNLGKAAPLPAFSRLGRKLKLGVVAKDFGADTDLYQLLPVLEELDRDAFEVVLYPLQQVSSELEASFQKCAIGLEVLPYAVADQIQNLMMANLDIALFSLNAARSGEPVRLLANARVAPLQIGVAHAGVLPGASQIDAYLTRARLTSASAEGRVLDLGKLANALSFGPGEPEPAVLGSRSDFGWKDDDLVVFVAGSVRALSLEVSHRLLTLAEEIASLRIVLQPLSDDAASGLAFPIFEKRVADELAKRSLPASRVVILSPVPKESSDRRSALALADLVIEPSCHSHVQVVVDAIAGGVPAYVLAGSATQSQPSSELLSAVGLDELVCADDAALRDKVRQVAGNRETLVALKQQVQTRLGEPTPVFDVVGASHVFGACVQQLFDRLVDDPRFLNSSKVPIVGVAKVSNVQEEITAVLRYVVAGDRDGALSLASKLVASEPSSPAAKWVYGKALLKFGNPARAVTFLLEGVQHEGSNKELWCDLAEALLQSGRPKQATEAVQACLNLDGKHLEAILILCKLAEHCGQVSELKDAVAAAEEIAPQDPRVRELASKVASLSGS